MKTTTDASRVNTTDPDVADIQRLFRYYGPNADPVLKHIVKLLGQPEYNGRSDYCWPNVQHQWLCLNKAGEVSIYFPSIEKNGTHLDCMLYQEIVGWCVLHRIPCSICDLYHSWRKAWRP